MLSIFSEHYETTYQLWEKNYKEHRMWRLNNMLLNNQWITEEIKEEIKNYLETNENENMTVQNLCDTTKVVLRKRFTAI